MATSLGSSVVVEDGYHSGLELIRTAILAMGSDGEWSYDVDYALHARSALELTRAQLDSDARDLLAQVDGAWKSAPARFNELFGRDHREKVVKQELQGWVLVDGKVPAIPRDHWWWSPLEVS